jgi:hypothetical protein
MDLHILICTVTYTRDGNVPYEGWLQKKRIKTLKMLFHYVLNL